MDRVHRPNANQTRSSQHDVYTDTEIRMKATRKMKAVLYSLVKTVPSEFAKSEK